MDACEERKSMSGGTKRPSYQVFGQIKVGMVIRVVRFTMSTELKIAACGNRLIGLKPVPY